MDAAMIARWNEVVGDDDDGWILGDFCAYRDGRLEEVFWRLRGRKHLVLGNHDEELPSIMDLPWDSPPEKHLLIHVEGEPVFLCHYPMLSWPKAQKGAVHLFGHMHGCVPGDTRMLDVGVDVWDYRPVTMTEIHRRLRTLKPHKEIDRHARRD
jgi:calcineurin-like phosphoesterase family protein